MLDLIIGIILLCISIIDFVCSTNDPKGGIHGKALRHRLHLNETLWKTSNRLFGTLFLLGSVLFITLAWMNYLTELTIKTKTVWSMYMIICIIIVEIVVFLKTVKW